MKITVSVDSQVSEPGLDEKVHVTKSKTVGCSMLLPMNEGVSEDPGSSLHLSSQTKLFILEQPPEPEQAEMASKSAAC